LTHFFQTPFLTGIASGPRPRPKPAGR